MIACRVRLFWFALGSLSSASVIPSPYPDAGRLRTTAPSRSCDHPLITILWSHHGCDELKGEVHERSTACRHFYADKRSPEEETKNESQAATARSRRRLPCGARGGPLERRRLHLLGGRQWVHRPCPPRRQRCGIAVHQRTGNDRAGAEREPSLLLPHRVRIPSDRPRRPRWRKSRYGLRRWVRADPPLRRRR